MGFFVNRATADARFERSQDRADVFARGDAAVLVVADGAGGLGDGGPAAQSLLDRARDAVLDASFDLLSPTAWERLFADVDRALTSGETTAVVVVLVPGMVLCTCAGDSEAWIVGPRGVTRLTSHAARARLGSRRAKPVSVVRGALEGRLVVASDGLFRHVPEADIVETMQKEPFGRVADALIARARLPSGDLADDVAVLVAEP
jgi:serine/threonine protein phosphatase PrpC